MTPKQLSHSGKGLTQLLTCSFSAEILPSSCLHFFFSLRFDYHWNLLNYQSYLGFLTTSNTRQNVLNINTYAILVRKIEMPNLGIENLSG